MLKIGWLWNCFCSFSTEKSDFGLKSSKNLDRKTVFLENMLSLCENLRENSIFSLIFHVKNPKIGFLLPN